LSRGNSENARNHVEHMEKAEERHLDSGQEQERKSADECCFQHGYIIPQMGGMYRRRGEKHEGNLCPKCLWLLDLGAERRPRRGLGQAYS